MSDQPPQHRVTVQPAGVGFDAAEDRSVLLSALAAGVRLPSSCRNGSCRECLCRLREGEITYAIEWPGLSADEKREGYVLPCVALPRSALVIEQPRRAFSEAGPGPASPVVG